MPKASVLLPNGTKIEIDGTVEEIQKLTEFYGGGHGTELQAPFRPKNTFVSEKPTAADDGVDQPDIAKIVALVRECDEAERIETRVLDQRDVLNRVLLCLWIVQRYVDPTMGLTSGEIERITNQLGVKVAISNASSMLSGKAKIFVTGDTIRKQGGTVRYRLNRRGLQHFESVLAPS